MKHKNLVIGISAAILLVGGFCGYKYATAWKYKDGDNKVVDGKIASSFSKQNGWTDFSASATGLDQSAIDKANQQYAKLPDGIYRNGVKI